GGVASRANRVINPIQLALNSTAKAPAKSHLFDYLLDTNLTKVRKCTCDCCQGFTDDAVQMADETRPRQRTDPRIRGCAPDTEHAGATIVGWRYTEEEIGALCVAS